MAILGCLLAGTALPVSAKDVGFSGDARTLDLVASDVSGDWSVDLFAQKVEELSKGALTIRMLQAVGEREVAGVVQAGTADIGQVFARGLDALDAPGVEVLLAPFVVDDIGLLEAIAEGPIGAGILADLGSHGVEGLFIAPGDRRFPVGLGAPLLTLADFSGGVFSVPPTVANQALVRSLGGEPVDIRAIDRAALDAAGVRGTVTIIGAAAWPDAYLTANLPVHAMPAIWIANPDSMAQLSEADRAVLADASALVRDEVSRYLPEVESSVTPCLNGAKVVMAEPADVAAIVAAAQPVIDSLAKDPVAADLLERIAALKAERGPAPVVRGCARAATHQPGIIADGAYSARLTRRDAVDTGWADECVLGGADLIVTIAIEGDRWTELQKCADGPHEVGSQGTLRYDGAQLFLKESFAPDELPLGWTAAGDSITLDLEDTIDEPVLRFLFEHTFTASGS